MAMVLVTTAVLGVIVLFQSINTPPAQVGARAFHILAVMTAAFCLIEGGRQTADCLSREAREGTLGLLFLADVPAYNVVTGKLVSASLNSIYGLFAIVPVMAVPVMLGGVAAGEVLRLALALLNTLWFSLVVGMAVSAGSRSERKAEFGTAAIIALSVFGSYFVDRLTFGEYIGIFRDIGPFWMCLLALEPDYSVSPATFWQSLAAMHGVGWLFFALACNRVKRGWRDQDDPWPPFARSATWQRLEEKFHEWKRTYARRSAMRWLLLENPVAWLAARRFNQPVYLWLAVIFIGGYVFVFFGLGGEWDNFGVPWLWIFGINLLFKYTVGAHACRALPDARRDGSLELVLATALGVRDIISGHARGLERKFRWVVIAWLVIGLLTVLASARQQHLSGLAQAVVAGSYFLVQGFFILDLYAMGSVGLWRGLKPGNTRSALALTALLVLVLPWAAAAAVGFIVGVLVLAYAEHPPAMDTLALFVVAAPGFTIFLSAWWNFYLIHWSQDQMYDEFRRREKRRALLVFLDSTNATAPPAISFTSGPTSSSQSA